MTCLSYNENHLDQNIFLKYKFTCKSDDFLEIVF